MHSTVIFRAVLVALVGMVVVPPAYAPAAEAPADRVVVMYFHRTNRCPTCQKMGGYSEEAVKNGFPDQLKDGTVSFHFINFEDPKNAAYTKGYGVSGPSLIVAKVANNKVAEHKSLKEIWSKVRDKNAFVDYVQESVKGYRNY